MYTVELGCRELGLGLDYFITGPEAVALGDGGVVESIRVIQCLVAGIEQELILGIVFLRSYFHLYLVVVALRVESVGVQGFKRHLTRGEDVETWENTGNFVQAIPHIDDLPLERVFVELVKGKVAGEPVSHKGVLVGKDNLNLVLVLKQPLFFYENLVIPEDQLIFGDSPAVH